MNTDRPETKSKNILTVELDSSAFEAMVPPLVHQLFDVDRFPTTVGALELISAVPFSAIVLNYPLQGMGTEAFLNAAKREESASRAAKIALLTSPADEPDAQKFLSKGVDLLVSTIDEPRQRQQLLCALLGIQPRSDERVLVRIEVILTNTASDRFVAQTKDVSSSGMFVITRKRHPLGSDARFEFTLLGEREPIRGAAEVVRHSESHERIQGMGFRFTSIDDDGGKRLRRRLKAPKEG